MSTYPDSQMALAILRDAAVAGEATIDIDGQAHMVSVCAWCRSACANHEPVLVMSDEDYSMVQSHGICGQCKAEQQQAAKEERARRARLRSLTVSNDAQRMIFLFEMEGQLSDGHWENARPFDHWCDWMLQPEQVLIGQTAGTRGFSPRRNRYNFANIDLLGIVGDRIRFKVALVRRFPELMQILEVDHWAVPDRMPEDSRDPAEWCTKQMERLAVVGITEEMLRDVWTNLDTLYSFKQLCLDCRALSMAVRTQLS